MYLVVVLTKRPFWDGEGFTEVLFAFQDVDMPEDRRLLWPADVITVLAESALDFSGPELFVRVEKDMGALE